MTLALPAVATQPPPAPDIRQALLAQRDAITNWAAFKAANSIAGWDEAEPNVCAWNGVNCTDSGMVYRL